jgi:hypothetical protein
MNHVEGGNNILVGGFYNHQEGQGNVNEEGWLYCHQEGSSSKAYNHNQHLRGGGMFMTGQPGDVQYSSIIARGITESGDPIPLTVSANADPVLIPRNKANTFRILVVASTADLASGAAYELKGLIVMGEYPATAAILGSVSKSVIAETDSAWDCNVTADTDNGAISITVSGVAATTIRWAAHIEMIEVAF